MSENRKQEIRKLLLGLTWRPSWPAHLAAQPTRGSPVFYLLPVGRGEAGHDARRGHVSPPPPASPPRRSGLPGRRHDAPHLSPSLSFLPLPWSLSHATARTRRRRRTPLPRPPPPPLPLFESGSSAMLPTTSPSSRASPDAPWSRRRRLFHRRPPWIPIDAPAAPVRPRAHFDCRCNRGELRHRFPLPV